MRFTVEMLEEKLFKKGMFEKLNCSSCNAIIEISEDNCEYCGNNYRVSGKSAELIKLRGKLDKMLVASEPVETIKFINNSLYKTHPIVRFRLAKAEMLGCLLLGQQIDSQKFCNILSLIDEISEATPAYRLEFINYTVHLLPTANTSLYSEDYEHILAFLKTKMFDSEEKLHNKLTILLLRTELGPRFMKEYFFYTDEKNFINDSAFLKKRDYLEEKYNKHKNELTKNNHSPW